MIETLTHLPVQRQNNPMLPGPGYDTVCRKCNQNWPCEVALLEEQIKGLKSLVKSTVTILAAVIGLDTPVIITERKLASLNWPKLRLYTYNTPGSMSHTIYIQEEK